VQVLNADLLSGACIKVCLEEHLRPRVDWWWKQTGIKCVMHRLAAVSEDASGVASAHESQETARTGKRQVIGTQVTSDCPVLEHAGCSSPAHKNTSTAQTKTQQACYPKPRPIRLSVEGGAHRPSPTTASESQ